MRCYISGPMTGIEDYNFPAFENAATELRRRGHAALSPHELYEEVVEDVAPNTPYWSDFLRADIPALCLCDTIVLLHGWHRSKGARLEHHIALELGMAVMTLAEALEEDVVAA